MARVYGITGSLKSLKSELINNGIYKFDSVKQIKDFLSNYKLEKLSILKSESDKLDEEYSNWLCIPKSIRMTSIKPSGTVSLLNGSTPGIHFPEDE